MPHRAPAAAQDFPAGFEFHKPDSNQKPRLRPHALPTAGPPSPSSLVPRRQPSRQEKALERADKSFPFRGFWGQSSRRLLPSGAKLSPQRGRQLGDGCWVLLPAPLGLPVPARAPHPHQMLERNAAPFLPAVLKPQNSQKSPCDDWMQSELLSLLFECPYIY